MNRIFANLISGVFLTLFIPRLVAQENNPLPMDFHAYIQLRFTSDFSDVHSFSLRRLKLWIAPKAAFSGHWDYKIQTTFSSNRNEMFFLQDVMLRYKSDVFVLKLGQFVPEYSLERFEHDYSLPLAERSVVIDRLIPNATMGVRDIGFEGSYKTPSAVFQTWLGVFNGNGIKEYRINNRGFLMTHKTAFHLLKNHWLAGYSVMYRKADLLPIPKVLPDSILFTGDDFRVNFFSKFQLLTFGFQTEYFYANLAHRSIDGYYFMVTWTKNKQSIAASYNQFTDLINSTSDDPEIHIAYSYLFNGDDMKLMLDNGIKVDNDSFYDYFVILQFQLFLH